MFIEHSNHHPTVFLVLSLIRIPIVTVVVDMRNRSADHGGMRVWMATSEKMLASTTASNDLYALTIANEAMHRGSTISVVA
ncbi:hypothetical protein SBOR_6712 [Sclerotinia borealis F-4128]|uniref:Uncharacterized protein n=1 Tax=Sclerotinia borealis (strain F-4128) TaxID=1432307 RepID=W9CAS0_SCLBF|nr:hypothetical protein SBOR_6712 [Sclerotinia borealis F-4128]